MLMSLMMIVNNLSASSIARNCVHCMDFLSRGLNLNNNELSGYGYNLDSNSFSDCMMKCERENYYN